MNLEKDVIDRVNDLKILHPSLNDLTIKDVTDIIKLIQEKVNEETVGQAENLFQEALDSNPELKILYLFIAITKLYFHPYDQLSQDQFLKKFFKELEKLNKSSLSIQICELLEKYYSSPFLIEYLVKSLKSKISQLGSGGERDSVRQELLSLLLKIHQNKVDENTELIADLICQSPNPEEWQEALFYYQTIFDELVKSNESREILRLWNKLIQSKPILEVIEQQEHFEKLIHILKHITGTGKENIKKEIFQKTISLKKSKEIANFSKIFKIALTKNIFLEESFNLLLQWWDELYQNQPGYFLSLKLSGIKRNLITVKNQGKINCQKLLKEMEDFEKLITMTPNTLVEHRSFGIGVVREINLTSKHPSESNVFLVIDFESKKKHFMSLRIAISSLEIIHPHHIKGIKLFFPEKISQVLSDEASLIKDILITLKQPASSKQIKSLMVPDIFNENQWKKKWKAIRNIIPNLHYIQIKNNQYSYNEHAPIIRIGSDTTFIVTYNKYTEIKDKLACIEEALHQHNEADAKSIKEEIGKLLANFKENINNSNEKIEVYFPALLAMAQRIKYPIDQKIWEQGRSRFSSSSPIQSYKISQTLSQSLDSLHYAATRIEFIKNLKHLLSPAEEHYVGAHLLNGINGSIKEHILDYWRQYFGDDSIRKIFAIIDKEYLTSLNSFILLAKTDIDKNLNLYPENKNQFFTKLIRALHQCHLNTAMNKNRIEAKKNFNTLYRILFEDSHLFNYLKNSSKENQEEQLSMLKSLEKKSYLDDNVKREVRILHTSLSQSFP